MSGRKKDPTLEVEWQEVDKRLGTALFQSKVTKYSHLWNKIFDWVFEKRKKKALILKIKGGLPKPLAQTLTTQLRKQLHFKNIKGITVRANLDKGLLGIFHKGGK